MIDVFELLGEEDADADVVMVLVSSVISKDSINKCIVKIWIAESEDRQRLGHRRQSSSVRPLESLNGPGMWCIKRESTT